MTENLMRRSEPSAEVGDIPRRVEIVKETPTRISIRYQVWEKAHNRDWCQGKTESPHQRPSSDIYQDMATDLHEKLKEPKETWLRQRMLGSGTAHSHTDGPSDLKPNTFFIIANRTSVITDRRHVRNLTPTTAHQTYCPGHFTGVCGAQT